MSSLKEETLTKLTQKVLQESLQTEGKNRFGLFSMPPAGISASTESLKKKTLGDDGKVITQPRGIYPGSPQSGKVASSYFSKISYVGVGDPYLDPEKRMKKLMNKSDIKHDVKWKNTSLFNSDPVTPPYKYMSPTVGKKRPARDQYGKVVTEKRNIFTSITHPGSGGTTIGILLSKPPAHMTEPYDRKRELERKEHALAKSKLQEQPFKNSTFPKNTFASDKATYSSASLLPISQKVELKPSKIHDVPFKPSNAPLTGTIGKQPEYIPNPPKKLERKRENSEPKKDPFRNGSKPLTIRPSPSISMLKGNLSREIARMPL